MKMSFVMDLKADGTALNAVNASMDGEEEGMKMHIPFGVEFGGTWSVNEDVLTLVVDSNSVKINFVADSLKIESTDPEKAALVDMMKGKMAKSLEEEMNKKDGEFIKGIYPEEGTQEFTFVLKGDELTLTEKKDSVGAPQLFKRVK